MVSRGILGGAFRRCPTNIGFAGFDYTIRSPRHVGQFRIENSHTIKSAPSTNSSNNREAVCVDLGGGILFCMGASMGIAKIVCHSQKQPASHKSNRSKQGRCCCCCCCCCCRRCRCRCSRQPPSPVPTYNSMFAASTKQTMEPPLARATSIASIGSTTITSWKWLDEFTVTGGDEDLPEEKVVPAEAFAKPSLQQVKNACGIAENEKKMKNQKKQPAAKPVTARRRPVPQSRALGVRTKSACTTPVVPQRQVPGRLNSKATNNNEDDDEPCLDEWQRTYTAFITRPSTHISTFTGQPIARRQLNTWGRHHYKPRRGSASTTATKGEDYHEASFYHHNSTATDGPTMIFLRGHVAISFETEEETIARGEWLAAQRALYQSRAPPPAPPGVVEYYDENDDARAHLLASIRKSKRATYAYMKKTVRFILLEQLGIDLSIPPTTTLIRHCNRSPAKLAF